MSAVADSNDLNDVASFTAAYPQLLGPQGSHQAPMHFCAPHSATTTCTNTPVTGGASHYIYCAATVGTRIALETVTLPEVAKWVADAGYSATVVGPYVFNGSNASQIIERIPAPQSTTDVMIAIDSSLGGLQGTNPSGVYVPGVFVRMDIQMVFDGACTN